MNKVRKGSTKWRVALTTLINQNNMRNAADECGIDWKEQAIKKVKDSMQYCNGSYNDLVSCIQVSGFTKEEAKHAVNKALQGKGE